MLRQDAVVQDIRLTAGMPTSRRRQDEATMVARARQGDAAALDELYRRHRDQMYTLCLNLCGNRDEAQDLLQETFVRAWRGLPRFAGRCMFSTWLYRIAVNLSRDAARRRRRAPDFVPSARVAHDSPVDDVRAALAGLQYPHRAVLVMRYFQSLSHKEIAECLHWSLSRVKVTLHRAKRAFKDSYLQMNSTKEARP
jgi:RNA polymerase sigma-70 factor (ECF subfamily)